jgi:TetR/AcrR family transcriptional regulator, transcriptional repressor for nem operon
MARPKEFDEETALAAALEVFWEKGFEATSVQDLTERMGIQKASLYNTFGDKRALFVRALDAYSTDTIAWYRQILDLDRPVTVREAFRRLFQELTRACADEDCRGCMCVNSAVELARQDPAVGAMLDRHERALEELFSQTIDRGKQTGEIPAALDTTATARYLLNVIAGLGVALKGGANAEKLADIVQVSLSVLDRN